MRVHHLNAITTCALGGYLMDPRTGGWSLRARISNHCLLAETASGLVLVDTGLGLRDVANPRGRLSRFFLTLVSPDFREEMTAARQVERLGYSRSDVRHIVLTHLDFDHAGGLDDFPGATVHLLASEREAALGRKTWLDRARYRPQQWSTQPSWRVYPGSRGERWFGFDCVRELEGLPPEILLVPLLGHTLGHAGVAVQTPRGWLFDTGDAYFYHTEMDVARPRCTPGLTFYQWMMQKDGRARRHNQKRLRELVRTRSAEVQVFCSHDVTEFERLAGQPLDVPAGVVAPAPAARGTGGLQLVR